MAKGEPLLEVTDLVKHFPIKSGIVVDREVARVRAVDGVSLTLTRAKRSAWWANPDAASRRCAARSCS